MLDESIILPSQRSVNTSKLNMSFVLQITVNSLPNDKFLDFRNWSKLTAFADDKVNVNEKSKFVRVLEMEENIVRNGENAGNQHFLLFKQCFQKTCFHRGVKSRDCVVKG